MRRSSTAGNSQPQGLASTTTEPGAQRAPGASGVIVRKGLFIGLIALVSVLAGATAVLAAHQFSDVPSSHPFHKDISLLADAGISTGFNDGTFRPSDPVTRQAMAAFLARGLGLGDNAPVADAKTLDGLSKAEFEARSVTDINQETAMAGGVTAADSPGFPVTISEAGSYRLTGNLVVSTTSVTAIHITVPGVTLDLNGYEVRGPVSCSGSPVTSCSASDGATGIAAAARTHLHGGTVQGFGGAGVSVGTDSRLTDLIVTHNAGHGVTLIGDGASLRHSTVTHNGGNGVIAGTGSGFAQVIESTIRGNALIGVSMCGGTLLNSNIHRNGGLGVASGCVAADLGYAMNSIRVNNANGTQVSGGRVLGCNVIQGAAVCP